jgi:hypothetical protein
MRGDSQPNKGREHSAYMTATLYRLGKLWRVTFYVCGEFDHNGLFETASDARLWCQRHRYTLTRSKHLDRP